MNNFIKQFTPEAEDVNWGVYLKGLGKESHRLNVCSSNKELPSEYQLSHSSRRKLNEYRVSYITKGSGVYITDDSEYEIKAGCIIISNPNEWHTLRPHKSCSWVGYWVGLDGEIVDHIMKKSFMDETCPVVDVGFREDIIDSYLRIFDFANEARSGFQQMSAGAILNLLGQIKRSNQHNGNSNSKIERLVQDACFFIRENVHKEIDFHRYAESQNVAYSYFRKMFKTFTGSAPLQYHLDLRILLSKEMLISTDKFIKEICFDLGFNSIYYFSRAFKKKIGVAPSEIRNRQRLKFVQLEEESCVI